MTWTVISVMLPALLGVDFSIDAPSSTLDLAIASSIANSGTLIGDHDAETNPGGTITIPGLWGGSGNQPIPIELASTITLAGQSNPGGFIAMEPFPDQGTAIIHDLSIDVLNTSFSSVAIPAELVMTVLYESFHTQNPTSVYPGGVPVDIPVGEGSLVVCLLEQSGGISVALSPNGSGGYDLLGIVPVLVTVQIEIAGEVIPIENIPAAMIIDGQWTPLAGGDRLELTLAIDQSDDADLPGDTPLPPIAVPLPTIIPPGGTANVVMTLTPQSASFALNVDSIIVAIADPQTLPCDVNGDGVINTDDILQVLSDWGPCSGCGSDTNDDGVVNVDDVLAVIACWPS